MYDKTSCILNAVFQTRLNFTTGRICFAGILYCPRLHNLSGEVVSGIKTYNRSLSNSCFVFDMVSLFSFNISRNGLIFLLATPRK